jgi:hypothetical protein
LLAGEWLVQRDELARLVREHLLAGHLIDRAAMPHVLAAHGPEAMGQVAIDEWMGASPIYSRRMRTLLAIEGDDVESIFKGMQLDVGAPPQFMDFRYDVRDPLHGSFRLASCGALLDVEPMGEELVHLMCHTIEDPTMDATAWATNPRARMRPVHRPPRVGEAHPEHCWWEVDIDPERDPVPEPTPVAQVAASAAAQLPLAESVALDGDEPGGRSSYDGQLEADLDLAAFDAPTLRAIDDEVCLQGHLLVLSFSMALAERFGDDVAREVGSQQLVGAAGVVAERLVRAFDLGHDDASLALLLELHPLLGPARYTGAVVAVGDDGVELQLGEDAPALREETPGAWIRLLADASSGAHEALNAIVAAADHAARIERIEPPGRSAGAAWRVVRDRGPWAEPGSVAVVRFSTGAAFEFEQRS